MNVPFAFARRHGVFVREAGGAERVMVFRANAPLTALAESQRVAGGALPLLALTDDQFETELQRSYEGSAQGNGQSMADLGEEFDLADLADELREPTDLLESADDAPIIRLINGVLSAAIRENASDIHIEPFESRLSIRLRVDGVLRQIMEPPAAIGSLLVSRIKIMAKLDIAEKRVPQDGRISLRIANRPVDVRVSTIPSGSGERVVLRLLDKQAGRLDLSRLGMAPATLAQMDALIAAPHGIVLVTGPTGSGKTTTLYAALSRLDPKAMNIMTVEDPIEYDLDGISQTQINTRIEMSFARALRTILRQDPDVVMIGEIRDLETAQIAVQASLTGHLVFATLHTNDAVSAVTRLVDMGVEPFLLASSMIGIVAQRLVRQLCVECRKPLARDAAQLRALGAAGTPGTYFAPQGCTACGHSGYKGRTGIYEFLLVDDDLRRLIHDRASEHDLRHHSLAGGMRSLRDDGIRLAAAGTISLEEVVRVTRE